MSLRQDYTLASGDSALYPLLHFVMDDLPTKSKAPELDAANTQACAHVQVCVCVGGEAYVPLM